MKKTLFALLCLLLALPAALQAQLSYTTSGGNATITGFTGSGAVVIPATTNSFTVTGIASGAFSNDTAVTIATIPNTLTSGAAYFSDPQWTNYPTRFYQLALP